MGTGANTECTIWGVNSVSQSSVEHGMSRVLSAGEGGMAWESAKSGLVQGQQEETAVHPGACGLSTQARPQARVSWHLPGKGHQELPTCSILLRTVRALTSWDLC